MSLKYDKPLSNVASGFNPRPYNMGVISRLPPGALWKWISVWQAANVKEGEPDMHFMARPRPGGEVKKTNTI